VLNEVFACQSIVRPRLWNDLGLSASGYGLGWTLAEYRGRRVFSHGGGGRGWRAIMVLDPSQRAGAMVMLAHEGGAAEGLALALLDLVAGRTPVTQVPAEAVVQAPPGLDDAPILTGDPTGLYAGDVTGKVRVFRSATGALHFAAEDAPAFDARLDAIDDSRFRLDFNNMAMTAMPGDPPFQLSFHRESGGGASAASTYFGRLRRIAP
jgi:hypothetical protein